MPVGLDLEASRRLIEAAEAYLRPQGEGLAAEVRSPVPQALADEFRALLQTTSPGETEMHSQRLSASVDMGGINEKPSIQGTVGPETSDLTADAPDGVHKANPAEASQSSEVEPMRPEDLYRLQFEMNMHLFETKTMVGVRDAASSRLDEMLRSSG